MTRYHCYLESSEIYRVYRSDVDADSAVNAARMAAAEHNMSGRWTVTTGPVIYVDVVERTTYEVEAAGPDG